MLFFSANRCNFHSGCKIIEHTSNSCQTLQLWWFCRLWITLKDQQATDGSYFVNSLLDNNATGVN